MYMRYVGSRVQGLNTGLDVDRSERIGSFQFLSATGFVPSLGS